ncbi:hypothetical protein BT93_L1138 [Corymbia citriodora subsp. variegata]|uniref:Sieve element occlusion N-terminal domain-containing protein n=1 Tax=Corymbia citriodora subsp. variegata TaxID=360336 RepID=A0A8T0D0N6_CORYI|nr:hypothetical protein BT93_L1138 [Corymbia citriodora subsp. variegata]
MKTRALSISSRGGRGGDGSHGTNIVGSIYPNDFLNIHNKLIDSVKGSLAYDSTVEGKCNPDVLLEIINNILTSAIALVRGNNNAQKVPTHASETIIPSDISHLINWISCQMTCEATRGKNLSESLSMIFQKLSSYQWTTQVLLVLAAFALHYGNFWYISEAPSDVGGGNALSTCLLKGLSSLKKKLRSDENMKAAVIPLNNVVNDLLELTNSLVGLYKLLNQHRGKHVPGLADAFREIPTWSCKTIIDIVDTGKYFARLVEDDDKFAESKLENLVLSVSHTKSTVLGAAKTCNSQIARMKEYQEFVTKVEAAVDIVDFLKSLLAVKDSSQDVKLKSFRKKKGLLIISDLEIPQDDCDTLEGIHARKETVYELVWIPVVDVDARADNLEEVPNFKTKMPWAVKQETMVVVLDSHGWVEMLNVMPKLRIWGASALDETPKDPFNWVPLVITPILHEELNAIKTDYTLFYGGTAASKLHIKYEIPQLSMVPVKDTKRFIIRLRSCLISRMEIVKTEMNPLSDSKVCEMCEAYKACQIGGFAILTKGRNLQKQHIGLFHTASTLVNDLKRVRELVDKDKGIDLAEAFKKKEPGVQEELSGCKHFYVPHYPGLGDLRCPDCGQFVRYDVSFVCCHSGSDQGGARHVESSAVANAK